MSTIAERVARGAALLDEKMPGWAEHIDLDTLNLASSCRCVLGQLHPNLEAPDDAYLDGLNHLDVSTTDDSGYGFDTSDEDDDEYERLTTTWRELIEARRAATRASGAG